MPLHDYVFEDEEVGIGGPGPESRLNQVMALAITKRNDRRLFHQQGFYLAIHGQPLAPIGDSTGAFHQGLYSACLQPPFRSQGATRRKESGSG